jgi:hypothetical protein
VLRADWQAALLGALDPLLDRRILEVTVQSGPAVDGVTRQQALSIDTLDISQHHRLLVTIRDMVRQTADR